MKTIQHPMEIALKIIKEGIEAGQKASDIRDDVINFMDIDGVVADRLIQDFISRKVFFKSYVEDDMMGKILFYCFDKPKPRPVKKIGTMIIAQSNMSGMEVSQSTGIRHFSKSHKGIGESFTPKPRTKRTVPQNSRMMTRSIPAVVYVRTKFPIRLQRTKFPIKFTRTK